MAALLRTKGWNITDEKFGELSANSQSANIENVLLNNDIKEFSSGGLPEDIKRNKTSKITGPLILQIQKIKNASAPSYRQESNTAPRMFHFTLTDGKQSITAIEMEPLNNIGFNTAPGTKLLLKGSVHFHDSIVLLNKSNCIHLGGQVDALLEKWKVKKDLLVLNRNTNRTDGAPPFVPFGQKINKEHVEQLSGRFKSLDIANANPDKPETDTSEFDTQRKAVIKEALEQQSGAVRKNYGGIKQAQADDPIERAKFKRPEKKPKKPQLDDKDPNVSDDEEYQGRGRGRKGKRGRRQQDDPDLDGYKAPSKPSGGSTLFDFLTDKIEDSPAPITNVSANTRGHQSSQARHIDRGRNEHYDGGRNERQDGGRNERYGGGRNERYGGGRDERYNEERNERYGGGRNERFDERRNKHYDGGQKERHDGERSEHHDGKQNKRYNGGRNERHDGGRNERYDGGRNEHYDGRRNDRGNTESGFSQSKPSQAKNVTPNVKAADRTFPKQQNVTSRPRSGSDRSTSSTHNKQRPESAPYHSRQQNRTTEKPASVVKGPSNTDAGRQYHQKTQTRLPDIGDTVLAKYWEDGKFYRFEVKQHISNETVLGVFVEYGNSEKVKVTEIKPFPSRDQSRQSQPFHQSAKKTQFTNYEGDHKKGLVFERSRNPRT